MNKESEETGRTKQGVKTWGEEKNKKIWDWKELRELGTELNDVLSVVTRKGLMDDRTEKTGPTPKDMYG